MKKKVLIVDDNTFMRISLKQIIENLGYEVVGEGRDGIEAFKLYKKHRPDLITMDITMPNRDGIAAVRHIIDFDSDAKIIMVSAMGQKHKVVDAVKAGAIDFVVKPFVHERIVEALEKHGI